MWRVEELGNGTRQCKFDRSFPRKHREERDRRAKYLRTQTRFLWSLRKPSHKVNSLLLVTFVLFTLWKPSLQAHLCKLERKRSLSSQTLRIDTPPPISNATFPRGLTKRFDKTRRSYKRRFNAISTKHEWKLYKWRRSSKLFNEYEITRNSLYAKRNTNGLYENAGFV